MSDGSEGSLADSGVEVSVVSSLADGAVQSRVLFDTRDALAPEVSARLDRLVGRYEARLLNQKELLEKQRDTILKQTRIIEDLSRQVDTMRLQHHEDQQTLLQMRSSRDRHTW